MKKSFKNQIRAALFAAIIAIITLISIPSPTGIPLTFQTFAVSLCGFTLGRKYGLEAVLIWLSVGIIGLPVFSGMTGGLGQIIGLTGGFLIGFIPLVLLCSNTKTHIINLIISMVGLILCHLIGIIWFTFISNTDLRSVILTISLPYIPKDILSIISAYGIAQILKKRLRTQ